VAAVDRGLADPHPRVRAAAAGLSGRGWDDPSGLVRGAALGGLLARQDPRAGDYLVAAVAADSPVMLRLAAVQLTSGLPDDLAVPVLRAALRDPWYFIPLQAVDALARKPRDGLRADLRELAGGGPGVRPQVAEAVARLLRDN
jgi:HEAT repeat protein